MVLHPRPCIIALALLGSLGIGRVARASEGFAMSNDGALTGGAAVVTGRDAPSVWYNPASLGANDRHRIDASANAFALRISTVPDAVVEAVGGRRNNYRLGAREFLVVPTAFGLAFSLPRNVSLGVAVHSPEAAEPDITIAGFGRDELNDYAYAHELRIVGFTRRYHLGLTVGWEPNPKFRVGFTANAVYRREVLNTRAFAVADGPSIRNSYLASDDLTSRLWGAEFVLGVQGQLTRWLSAGATVRSPALRIYHRFRYARAISAGYDDAMGERQSELDLDNTSTESPPIFLPWVVSAGLAAKLPDGAIELDVQARTRVSGDQDLFTLRGTWNVRLGGYVTLTERFTLGAGLFTDRGAQLNTSLAEIIVERWGGSIAGRLRTPVTLSKGERARNLVFGFTGALRYSVGTGSAAQVRWRFPTEAGEPIELTTSQSERGVQHLLALHVGTALEF